MRKTLFLAFMAMALTANAETETPVTTQEAPQEAPKPAPKKWYESIKFSGYGMLQYIGSDKYGSDVITNPDGTKEVVPVKDPDNSFNLRLVRFIIDAKIYDFDVRAQIQGTNAKGPGEPTVQLVDLYAEWVKYKEFRVRVGQFKRAFTFENPTHPITQGWRGYADVINNLSGNGDRTGEKSSGGRDIGIQVQGDVLPNANERPLLHYQVGVYNGEGVNQKDQDNCKDIIGGVWVMPIKGLRIGAFGWTGTRGSMVVGSHPDPITGAKVDDLASVRKNRYALSAEYNLNEYTFRAEYLHSQGWGAAKAGNNVRAVDYSLGDKADGWYVFGIVPVIKSKLHAKARYQCYRDNKHWDRAKTSYEIGLNYFFTKNLELHVEYARVNDRSLLRHNYNLFDAEFDFRF